MKYAVPATDHGWWYDDDAGTTCCQLSAGAHETNRSMLTWAGEILAEIDSDIRSGLVPATVASFRELHDHVDANDYASQVIPADAAPTWDMWMQTANHVEGLVSAMLAARSAA